MTVADVVPYRSRVSVDREQLGRATAAGWRQMADAIAALPEAARIRPLINLAQQLRRGGNKGDAGVQAFAAWRLARRHGDAAGEAEAHRLLGRCLPAYHTHVSTDPVRLAAWEAALSATILPGMQVLEIGTGCGILAMLAARCGAARVTTCERDPALAAIAEEIVTRNGLEDQINILAKAVQELRLPGDLDQAADLLLLDLFADSFFTMAPFRCVREAVPLLKPGAVIVPRRALLIGALAYSSNRRRTWPEAAAGFDVSPLSAVSPFKEAFRPSATDRLCGPEQILVEAHLPDAMPDDSGEMALSLTSDGGPVNGMVTWIRLELAEGRWIDAQPEPNSTFYAHPLYYPLAREWKTVPGERVAISLKWSEKLLSIALNG